jgi:hypothetical protein
MNHRSSPRKHAPNRIQDLAGSIDLPELLQVLGIDERTREHGKILAAILDEHGDVIFSEFYERISKISFAYKFEKNQVDILKRKQLVHWKCLFSGDLDMRYVRNAAVVGDVHRQRGIEPLLYIVGYSIVKSAIMEIIARKELPSVNKGQLMVALEKCISLDVGLAMVGYSGHKVFARLFAPGLSG